MTIAQQASFLLQIIFHIRDFSRRRNMGSSVQAQGAIPPGLVSVVNHFYRFGAVRDWRLESKDQRLRTNDEGQLQCAIVRHSSFVVCHVGGSLQYLTPRAELHLRLIRRGYV